MKKIRGFRKKYFSMSAMAVYSTLDRLNTIENNLKHCKNSIEYTSPNKAPPSN